MRRRARIQISGRDTLPAAVSPVSFIVRLWRHRPQIRREGVEALSEGGAKNGEEPHPSLAGERERERGYQTDKNLARELSFEKDVLSSIIDFAQK
jgi:hypothetical protein